MDDDYDAFIVRPQSTSSALHGSRSTLRPWLLRSALLDSCFSSILFSWYPDPLPKEMEYQKDRCEGRYVGGCGYACCGEIFDTRQVAQVGHWDGFWVKKNICNVSCEGCFGFCVSDWWGVGCQIDEETSNKLELSMVQLLICCCFVSQSLWYASSLQITCSMKFHLGLFCFFCVY